MARWIRLSLSSLAGNFSSVFSSFLVVFTIFIMRSCSSTRFFCFLALMLMMCSNPR
jgi:dolichyl-phosphate-mannose--protein O-mannosyl transferase